MKPFVKIVLILLIITLTGLTKGQVVYEPLYEDVYNFLGRISQKGIIEFDDLIRPLPRSYISNKLLEADSALITTYTTRTRRIEIFIKRLSPRTLA